MLQIMFNLSENVIIHVIFIIVTLQKETAQREKYYLVRFCAVYVAS
jgi:hypothetical protein